MHAVVSGRRQMKGPKYDGVENSLLDKSINVVEAIELERIKRQRIIVGNGRA